MKRWLILLAALTIGSAAAPPPAGPPPTPVDLLRTMVEADTTHGTRALAVALRGLMLAQGFVPADAQLLAPDDKPNQANLVMRLRGSGRAAPVLFIGHLDVVPTAGQSWTVEPFALTAKGGFLYGRGALDMKGENVAMLLGLIAMRRSGLVPDRDIILALTADEETGAADGIDWLLKTHRSAIDAAFVVNPDEGAAGERHGVRDFYGIQTSTKRYVTYRLSARAPGGHSDLPPARNAVFVLAAALGRLDGYRLPVHLTEATRANFAALAERASSSEARDLHAVLATDPGPAAVERLSVDPQKAAALRSTCVPTMLHASEQENVIAEEASATIQCRLLPGDDPKRSGAC